MKLWALGSACLLLSAGAQTNAPLALSVQGAVQLALLQNRDLAKLAVAHESALLEALASEGGGRGRVVAPWITDPAR